MGDPGLRAMKQAGERLTARLYFEDDGWRAFRIGSDVVRVPIPYGEKEALARHALMKGINRRRDQLWEHESGRHQREEEREEARHFERKKAIRARHAARLKEIEEECEEGHRAALAATCPKIPRVEGPRGRDTANPETETPP